MGLLLTGLVIWAAVSVTLAATWALAAYAHRRGPVPVGPAGLSRPSESLPGPRDGHITLPDAEPASSELALS